MDLPLFFPLPANSLLLPGIHVIQDNTQKECDQHGYHNDENILVDCLSLPLDCFHRHITNQKNSPVIDRPHIIKCIFLPDIVVKQEIIPRIKTFGNLPLYLFILDAVRPVKIVQVQMPRVPLSHPLWFQDKALARGIHNIKCCFFIIKFVWKGFINRIVYIFGIEHPDFLPIPLDRAFYCIGPRPHIVYVRL